MANGAQDDPTQPLNYSSYLQLDQLLALQTLRSEPAQHDEMLFIVVHQVSELWFKEMLWELDKIKSDFTRGSLDGAIRTFTRCRRIQEALVAPLGILETMTPMSFAAFRARLDTASGFESMQFRMLEYTLGLKNRDTLDMYPKDLPGLEQAREYFESPSLVNGFHHFLAGQGVPIPNELLAVDVTESVPANEVVQRGILELYRNKGEAITLFELMLDFDQGFQEWRYRHFQLVRRTIGDKVGTAGSLGADFLMRTLHAPVFPDLWAIRHEL